MLSNCQVEEDVVREEDQINAIYKDETARYLEELKLNATKKQLNKIEELSAAIDMNTLKIYDLKSTQKVLIVDVKSLNGVENSNKIKTLFFLIENKIIRSRIVTFSDKTSFNDKDYNKMILSILDHNKDKNQYSGLVSFYSPYQNKLLTDQFESGILTENGTLSLKSTKNKMGKTNGCTDWYWVTYYSNGTQTSQYVYTTCTPCEEMAYKTTNDCGGGSGGGSSSGGTGSGPSFPYSPNINATYDYFSPEGEHIRFQFINNEWKIILISLPEVVVKAVPESRPYLVFNWPQDQQRVYGEGFVFTYKSESGSWEGIPLDTVIVDPTFENNPCLKGVYDKLGGAPTFQNYLKEYDGDFSLIDLKLSVGVDAQYSLAGAVTYKPINSLIEIKFNPNKLNTPPLNIARTFIHEMIHAETYRKLLILSEEEEIPWSSAFIESIKNNEKEIAHYYMMYKYEIPLGGSPSEPQHEYMAQLSRKIITDVMKQFDSSQSDDVYNALAWIGLIGEGEPNPLTGLPPQPTAAWVAIPQAERVRILKIYFDFIENNTPCQ